LPENTFITNQADKQIKTTLNTPINYSSELKFLVGLLYFPGIAQLYRALKPTPGVTLKVLMVINVDMIIYYVMVLVLS
jgi:hypothetical protein